MNNLWLQVLPTFGAFRQVPWRRLKVTTDGYELNWRSRCQLRVSRGKRRQTSPGVRHAACSVPAAAAPHTSFPRRATDSAGSRSESTED